MSVDIGTLVAQIQVDVSKLDIGLKLANKRVEDFSDRVSRTGRGVDQSFSQMGAGVNRLVGYLGSLVTIGAVTKFGIDSVKAAAESEQAWNDVGAALKRHGMEVDNNLKAIQRFGTQYQRTLGYSDELVGKMVQRFVDFGATVPQAMGRVGVAMDLAAGKGIDLEAAVDLLAKASKGATDMLGRYGIVIDSSLPKAEKFKKAVEEINKLFGGAAQARVGDMATKINVLSEAWGEFQEGVGAAKQPEVVSGINLITSALYSLTDWVKSDIGVLDWVTGGLKALFGVGDGGAEMAARLSGASGAIMELNERLSVANVKFNETQAAWREMFAEGKNGTKEFAELSASLVYYRTEVETLTADIEKLRTASGSTGTIGESLAVPSAVVQSYQTIHEKIHSMYAMLIELNAQGGAGPIKLPMDDFKGSDLSDLLAPKDTTGVSGWIDNAWEKQKTAARQEAAEIKDIEDQLADGMAASMMSAAGSIVDIFFGVKTSLADIFKNMAMDFTKLFIDAILGSVAKKLATGLLKALALFDVPANDRFIANEGARAGMFFQQGFVGSINGMGFGAKVAAYSGAAVGGGNAGSASGQAVYITHEYNGVVSEDFQRDTIERTGRASYRRQVQIEATNDRIFGRSVAFRSA